MISTTHIGNAHDELAPSVEGTLFLALLHIKQVDLAVVATSGKLARVSREGKSPNINCQRM